MAEAPPITIDVFGNIDDVQSKLGTVDSNIKSLGGSVDKVGPPLDRVKGKLATTAVAATTFGDKAKQVFGALGPAIRKVMVAVAALAAAFLSVRTAARAFVTSVNVAAEAETMKTQFQAILGSAGAATERFKELTEFAASTPFELGTIAKASRVLETLTDGTLSTGDGLRMVGDAAAASGAPMDELAVHAGRAYAALQGGTAAGESLARFQELGILTASARQEIEALQAEGAKGEEVWGILQASLAKSSGAMELMSKNWNGLTSTLRDNVKMLYMEFGTPVIDALKPVLVSAIKLVTSLLPAAKRAGEVVARVITMMVAVLRRMVELFKSGELTAVIAAALRVAGKEFINFIFDGFIKIMGFILDNLGRIGFWFVKKLKEGLVAAFKVIFPIIVRLKDKLVAAFRLASLFLLTGVLVAGKAFLDLLAKSPIGGEKFQKAADSMEGMIGTAENAMAEQLDVLRKPLIDKKEGPTAWERIKLAIKSGKLMDSTADKEFLKNAFAGIFDDLGIKTADTEKRLDSGGKGAGEEEEEEDTTDKIPKVLGDSLAKLGGGGARSISGANVAMGQKQLNKQAAMVDEQKITNKKLADMDMLVVEVA